MATAAQTPSSRVVEPTALESKIEAGRPAQVLGLQHRCVGCPLAAATQRRIQEAPKARLQDEKLEPPYGVKIDKQLRVLWGSLMLSELALSRSLV